jgi:hypothetical protein
VNVSWSSNIDDVLGSAAKLHPQFRFAVSRALNLTMRDVHGEMAPEVSRALDRPVQYTKQGFYWRPSRKDALQAEVGVKTAQAEYMQYMVHGGRRSPKRKALRLPSVVQLNEHGNIPRGLIKQLIARARAGKKATANQGQRAGLSSKLDLFYGDPQDGRPAGLYKRVVLSPSRHQLIPIVVFPQTTAKYQERTFDFYGIAHRNFSRSFNQRLAQAWREALATAK